MKKYRIFDKTHNKFVGVFMYVGDERSLVKDSFTAEEVSVFLKSNPNIEFELEEIFDAD